MCTFELFTLGFHFLDHLMDDMSKFDLIFALDASQYKQFNASIKASYCHRSEQSATSINEMVFGPDQMRTNASGRHLMQKKKFYKGLFWKRTMRPEKEFIW